MHAIVATALCYSHPDGTPVLGDVSFRLAPRRYGLVGANGSGKTTLLRLLHRDLHPAAGNLHVPSTTEYLEQFETSLEPLSAGERMRNRLTATFGTNAGWLLLDEPSNHLDGAGRNRLYHWLAKWNDGIIAASHDRELLRLMDAIIEVADGNIRLYEGSYDVYVQEREAEIARARAEVRNARAAFERERAQDIEERLRSVKRANAGKAHAQKANLPKVFRGGLERKAQNSAARAARTQELRLAAAGDRLDEARTLERREISIDFDVPLSEVPAGRDCFRETGFAIDFISGPERIGIQGPNGSGKTTLLRFIEGHALVPVAHLDQHLDNLPKTGTLAEAMRNVAPREAEHLRRTHLARLGFTQDRTELPIAYLSGGERMRAALALIFARERPPQLLLLDEPEAHLDLQSLEELASALRNYRGALVIVSHDESLLADLRVDRIVTLSTLRTRPGRAEAK